MQTRLSAARTLIAAAIVIPLAWGTLRWTATGQETSKATPAPAVKPAGPAPVKYRHKHISIPSQPSDGTWPYNAPFLPQFEKLCEGWEIVTCVHLRREKLPEQEWDLKATLPEGYRAGQEVDWFLYTLRQPAP